MSSNNYSTESSKRTFSVNEFKKLLRGERGNEMEVECRYPILTYCCQLSTARQRCYSI